MDTILATKQPRKGKKNDMITISARDFRANQGKYLKKAVDGADIILSTRDYGSFRIIPVTEEDKVYNEEELQYMIDEAIKDYEEGRTISYTAKELREMAGL